MKFQRVLIFIIICLMMINSNYLKGQESQYYPNGDPDKWNVQLTPFLWLPWMSGELESPYLQESFGASVTDILSNLKFAFMINADVSKGKFFATPSYVFCKLGKAITRQLFCFRCV